MLRILFLPVMMLFVFLASWSLITNPVSASVVVAGTRVIYSGDMTQKTVKLTNHDNFPNVIQAWVDVDNPESTPDKADAPFIVTPPIFRIDPGRSQSLRILFTGKDLPQDRESLFYLNIQQIPPRSEYASDKNQVVVILRNRLKVFYRPMEIDGDVENIQDHLKFNLIQNEKGWHIYVDNQSPYFASFSGASVLINGGEVALQAKMIKPMSQMEWVPERMQKLPDGKIELNAWLINDYGVKVNIRHEFSR